MSLAVKMTAAPDTARADMAVIETLAKACRMPGSALQLVAGETDRNKTILVTGNPVELEAWIAGKVNAGKEN